MTELTDFPPEEQKLINEMLSLDYTREDFEQRKWEIMCALSTDGLVYVREHIFDIVYNKLETDTNEAIMKLEKLDLEQREKQKIAIQQCREEERSRCNYLIASVCMGVGVAIAAWIWVMRF